jgi:hypothetical protein
VHLSEQIIVKGSAYKLGIEGQTKTQLFVDGSLYSLAVVLHEPEHFLVVLSEKVPYGQDLTHRREKV